MVATPHLYDSDLWEAWVDLETSSGFATLYVVGSVVSADLNQQPFFGVRQQDDEQLLILEMHLSPNICAAYEHEVLYEEVLDNLCQYQTIKIYAGNELVNVITDIITFV